MQYHKSSEAVLAEGNNKLKIDVKEITPLVREKLLRNYYVKTVESPKH